MSDHSSPEFSPRSTLIAVAVLVLVYLFAMVMGWPQEGTRLTVESHHSTTEGHDHGEESPAESPGQAAVKHTKLEPPPVLCVLPFVILLGCIAVLPLIHFTEHWWESNLHRFYVAGALGLITLGYYLILHAHPVERHFLVHSHIEPQDGLNWNIAWTVIQNAMFQEYLPFIVLLFSLYAISGGIRIEGDLPAHPLTNTIFIGIGAALASFVGTTGAAMLLIRPLLETNRERKHRTHTVVFFIFAVCNCGGCLLPIGDPPLFLGYLEGVEFLWTLTALWKEWLFVNLCLLAVYYAWDHFYAYPREAVRDIARDETEIKPLAIDGKINFFWLLGVILAVALLDPSKPFPGTHWHPSLFMREVVQIGLVGLSLLTTEASVRIRNHFNYAAILEVAALFVGIFICMQPALQILDAKGSELGLSGPQGFYWATGSLSAVLDNAPTYLVFFKTAAALDKTGAPMMGGVEEHLLVAISLGAVFMGAMTYIGNGPNFMVKAIAETRGVKMPSFFGYIVYSVCVLLPILVACSLLFL